jgi:hypothetical protein
METETHTTQAKTSWLSSIITALLFLFCAVPGLIGFLVSSVTLSASVGGVKEGIPHPVVSALLNILSILLMVVGTGKGRQWYYLLVFPPFPIVLSIFFLLPDDDKSSGKGAILLPLLIAGIIMFSINSRVREHYQSKGSE